MAKTPGNSQPIPAIQADSPVASADGDAPVRNQLRRSFRIRDGVALIVSNVIGAGVFTTSNT